MSAAESERVAAAPDDGDLTRFQFEVLYALAATDDEARYGMGIKRDLEEYYGEDVNHGRLYPNLDKLADAGLLDKAARDERTNEYGLTVDGRELLRRDAQRRESIAATLGGDV